MLGTFGGSFEGAGSILLVGQAASVPGSYGRCARSSLDRNRQRVRSIMLSGQGGAKFLPPPPPLGGGLGHTHTRARTRTHSHTRTHTHTHTHTGQVQPHRTRARVRAGGGGGRGAQFGQSTLSHIRCHGSHGVSGVHSLFVILLNGMYQPRASSLNPRASSLEGSASSLEPQPSTLNPQPWSLEA